MLTDFQNLFTDRFIGEYAAKWSLIITPHLKCVTALPCETSISENQRTFDACIVINDKSQATRLRCGGLFSNYFTRDRTVQPKMDRDWSRNIWILDRHVPVWSETTGALQRLPPAERVCQVATSKAAMPTYSWDASLHIISAHLHCILCNTITRRDSDSSWSWEELMLCVMWVGSQGPSTPPFDSRGKL